MIIIKRRSSIRIHPKIRVRLGRVRIRRGSSSSRTAIGRLVTIRIVTIRHS